MGRELGNSPHILPTLFNSGFDANTAFFECIPRPGDVVVFDEYIHASLHDGMKASRRLWFRHNDVADLKRVLKGVRERARLRGACLSLWRACTVWMGLCSRSGRQGGDGRAKDRRSSFTDEQPDT
ncbi:hypothetical protein AX14_009562 [Amanita brunnescens Koide BX004]|nr:hypothetical protein AX14_009562 [Amanita brunnescens Koide BX004]